MPQYETIMTFESKSSKTGKCYTVKGRVDTGAISCDCPQWVFNRNGDRTCYHTERVKVISNIGSKSPSQLTRGELEVFKEIKRLTPRVSIPSEGPIPNEGPITEKPRQLRLEKKEG